MFVFERLTNVKRSGDHTLTTAATCGLKNRVFSGLPQIVARFNLLHLKNRASSLPQLVARFNLPRLKNRASLVFLDLWQGLTFHFSKNRAFLAFCLVLDSRR
jgi:hypothetical protein